jgi:hypothetical protein
MGSKPLLSVGALVLGGLVMCGCQNQPKTTSPFGGSSTVGKQTQPPPFPPPSPGSGMAMTPTNGMPSNVGAQNFTTGVGPGPNNFKGSSSANPYGSPGSGNVQGLPSNPGLNNTPGGFSSANPSPSNFGSLPASGNTPLGGTPSGNSFGSPPPSSAFATGSGTPSATPAGFNPSLPPVGGSGSPGLPSATPPGLGSSGSLPPPTNPFTPR